MLPMVSFSAILSEKQAEVTISKMPQTIRPSQQSQGNKAYFYSHL